jgi:hypothetical protein
MRMFMPDHEFGSAMGGMDAGPSYLPWMFLFLMLIVLVVLVVLLCVGKRRVIRLQKRR